MNKKRLYCLSAIAKREKLNFTGMLLMLASVAMNFTYLSKLRMIIQGQTKISFLTPLLFVMCSPTVFPSPHFFMSAFLLFSLSKYPQTGNSMIYHIIRMTRKKWITYELMSMLLYTVVFIVTHFIICDLALLPHISLSIEWNAELPLWQDLLEGKWNGGIPYAIIFQLAQTHAFVLSITLWWLFSLFGGLVLITMRLLVPTQRLIGIGFLFVLYFYDYICEYCLPYVFRYISPVALSRISFLNLGFDPSCPSIFHAYIFFLISIIILVRVIYALSRHVDLDLLFSRT